MRAIDNQQKPFSFSLLPARPHLGLAGHVWREAEPKKRWGACGATQHAPHGSVRGRRRRGRPRAACAVGVGGSGSVHGPAAAVGACGGTAAGQRGDGARKPAGARRAAAQGGTPRRPGRGPGGLLRRVARALPALRERPRGRGRRRRCRLGPRARPRGRAPAGAPRPRRASGRRCTWWAASRAS